MRWMLSCTNSLAQVARRLPSFHGLALETDIGDAGGRFLSALHEKRRHGNEIVTECKRKLAQHMPQRHQEQISNLSFDRAPSNGRLEIASKTDHTGNQLSSGKEETVNHIENSGATKENTNVQIPSLTIQNEASGLQHASVPGSGLFLPLIPQFHF
eukprot:331620-Rhodomonas_salina.2